MALPLGNFKVISTHTHILVYIYTHTQTYTALMQASPRGENMSN